MLQVVDLGVGAAAAGGGDGPAQGAVLGDQAAGRGGDRSQTKPRRHREWHHWCMVVPYVATGDKAEWKILL